MSQAQVDIPLIPYERPPLYGKQRAFVDSPQRYTVVEASTKTGKTVACLIWIFERALAGLRGQNFWWVAPIYAQAGIAYTRLVNYLNDAKLSRSLWHECKSEQAIDICGRKIWFKGADHADSLYGEDVYAAVIDEATRCSEDAWHAVRSTLTATRGPVKIIGNVRGRRNWAYMLARRAEGGADGMAYHKLTAYDAVEGGVLDATEVADAKAILPDAVFRELYLAEPSDDAGNPFGIEDIRACIGATSGGKVVAWGVDLAKSQDWTVAVGLDSGGSVAHLERWQGLWRETTPRLVRLIGDTPALIDSTGVGDPILEDLQHVLPQVEGYKFTATSKQQLMEGLACTIHGRHVTYPAGWLVDELNAFEYEYTKTGVRYSAPEGLHDDGVCALALAVSRAGHKPVELDFRLVGAGAGRDDPFSEDDRIWRGVP